VTYVDGTEFRSMMLYRIGGAHCDNCHKRFDEDGNELCEHLANLKVQGLDIHYKV